MKILKMNIKNLHIILGLLSVLFCTVIANGFDGDAIKEEELETELKSIEKEDRSLESHEAMQGGNSVGATASPNVHTSRPNTFDGKFFAKDDRDKRMQAAYIANLPDPNASESLLELLVTIAAQPERWNDLIRYVNKVLKTRVNLDPNLQSVNTEYQHNISKQVPTEDTTPNLIKTDKNKKTTSTQDNIQHMIILLNMSKTQNKKSHNLDQQLNDLKYIHGNTSDEAKLQTMHPTTRATEKQNNRDTNGEYNDQSTTMYVNNYDKHYVTSSYSNNNNNKDNKDETKMMTGSNKRPSTVVNDPTLITPSRASDDYRSDKDNVAVDPQLTTKEQSTIATQQTVTEKTHGTNNGRETFAFHRVTVRPSDKTRARNAYIAVSVIAPRLRQYYGNKRDELESELLRLKQPPWSHKRNLRNMQNLRTKWNITTLPAVTP